MASSTREANAPPLVSMEGRIIVATGHDHCKQLKDVVSKEDPSSMLVVMTSSNKTATPPNPPCPFMDPGLLALACSGSWKKLQSFLKGDSLPTSRSSAIPQSSQDEEAQIRLAFLDGVTVEGDTFLHVMATNSVCEELGEDDCLVRTKAVEYISIRNMKNGDTPLHCAARAGKSRMVTFLLQLVVESSAGKWKELLEKENNSGWTVLHEAVHVGNNHMVKELMNKDPGLACIPKDGTSPMYLAILLERKVIAETLQTESGGVLSYSGPKGQNALHAAVLRSRDLTQLLLGWSNTLAIQQDENGSTPLHLVASVLPQGGRIVEREQHDIRLLLLKANPEQLYHPDKCGLYPIHVAASVGATVATLDFLEKSPRCAGLRDSTGRTFLHVAVDQVKVWTVMSACINQSLWWIFNMQDNYGDTALHLAVRAGHLSMFRGLFGNRQVHLSLTNEKGETTLDIARRNLPKEGLYYNQNSAVKIHRALKLACAASGICRHDYLETNNNDQARQDEINKREMVKDSTQNLSIGSVLITTVTFGATFAMPGGYRADDHTNGGAPTLAGRYAFDAFMVANTLAFTFSAIATIGLMSSGSPMYSLPNRVVNLHQAFSAMLISVSCLVAAFALATYIMLAPVAHTAAITVCVLSSLILVYSRLNLATKNAVLYALKSSRFLGIRHKILLILVFPVSVLAFIFTILYSLLPIVVIFGLSALNYTGHKTEPEAQPATPLA